MSVFRAIANSLLKPILWNNGCCNYFDKEVLLPDFRNLNGNRGGAEVLIQNGATHFRNCISILLADVEGCQRDNVVKTTSSRMQNFFNILKGCFGLCRGITHMKDFEVHIPSDLPA